MKKTLSKVLFHPQMDISVTNKQTNMFNSEQVRAQTGVGCLRRLSLSVWSLLMISDAGARVERTCPETKVKTPSSLFGDEEERHESTKEVIKKKLNKKTSRVFFSFFPL